MTDRTQRWYNSQDKRTRHLFDARAAEHQRNGIPLYAAERMALRFVVALKKKEESKNER